MEYLLNIVPAIAGGLEITLQIFVITIVLSLPLGILMSIARISRIMPLRKFMGAYIYVMRGTPLMLQIVVVFYVPGLLFNYPMTSRFAAVLAAFVINYACYFSEIYRGGIESVSRGQYEAAQVLGMTKAQTFFRIILPQVVKRIVPPMSNEIITLVKDTSLARIISVGEIIFSAQTLVNHYAVIWPLFYAGAFYLIFNGILTLLFRYIEKKLDYYKV